MITYILYVSLGKRKFAKDVDVQAMLVPAATI